MRARVAGRCARELEPQNRVALVRRRARAVEPERERVAIVSRLRDELGDACHALGGERGVITAQLVELPVVTSGRIPVAERLVRAGTVVVRVEQPALSALRVPDRDRAVERCDRVVAAAEPAERVGAVVPGVGVPGVARRGSLVRCDRLGELPGALQGIAEVVPRVAKARAHLHGTSHVRDRVRMAALFELAVAAVRERHGGVAPRPIPRRLARGEEAVERARVVALGEADVVPVLKAGDRVLEVRARQAAVERALAPDFERLLAAPVRGVREVVARVVDTPECEPNARPLAQRSDVARVEREGGRERGLGLGKSVEIAEREPAPVMRPEARRIGGDHGVERGDRLFCVTRDPQRESQLEAGADLVLALGERVRLAVGGDRDVVALAAIVGETTQLVGARPFVRRQVVAGEELVEASERAVRIAAIEVLARSADPRRSILGRGDALEEPRAGPGIAGARGGEQRRARAFRVAERIEHAHLDLARDHAVRRPVGDLSEIGRRTCKVFRLLAKQRAVEVRHGAGGRQRSLEIRGCAIELLERLVRPAAPRERLCIVAHVPERIVEPGRGVGGQALRDVGTGGDHGGARPLLGRGGRGVRAAGEVDRAIAVFEIERRLGAMQEVRGVHRSSRGLQNTCLGKPREGRAAPRDVAPNWLSVGTRVLNGSAEHARPQRMRTAPSSPFERPNGKSCES